MNMNKYEKIWLFFGTVTLLVFLTVVGISAFYMGNQPPSCAVTIHPEKVDETAPFDDPGLRQIGDNEYQFTIVASAFNYDVGTDEEIKAVADSLRFLYRDPGTGDIIHSTYTYFLDQDNNLLEQFTMVAAFDTDRVYKRIMNTIN